MNGRSGFTTVGQLTRDTFRQANASGIFWMMLAVTGICTALCLSVSIRGDVPLRAEDEPGFFLPRSLPRNMVGSAVLVLGSAGTLDTLSFAGAAALAKTPGYRGWLSLEVNPAAASKEGIETAQGRMTLAFGAVVIPMSRERDDAVRFLELLLSGGIAGTFGLLLALVWTAGFVPTFLEPSAAAVLLAKPVPRWQLLLGKYLGVLTFVASQVTLFVFLTWLALGLRTQVWDVTCWVCIPLLLLQFAVFYSFSVLLGVLTRSTVACVFGSLLFWLLGWGINYGSVLAHGVGESQSLPPFTLFLTEAAYWISPKPIDAGLILFDALDAQQHFDKPGIFKHLESWQGFSPVLSIVSCLAIAVFLLGLSAHEFNDVDY